MVAFFVVLRDQMYLESHQWCRRCGLFFGNVENVDGRRDLLGAGGCNERPFKKTAPSPTGRRGDEGPCKLFQVHPSAKQALGGPCRRIPQGLVLWRHTPRSCHAHQGAGLIQQRPCSPSPKMGPRRRRATLRQNASAGYYNIYITPIGMHRGMVF